MVTLALSSFLFALPAQAATSHDHRLRMTISPSQSAITAGTPVTINLTLTNIGVLSAQARGMFFIFLPLELDFESIDASFDHFCADPLPSSSISDFVFEFPSNYVTCLATNASEYLLPENNPGQSHTVNITAIANQAFTPNQTKVFAVNYPADFEAQFAEFDAAFLDWDGQTSSLPTNNVSTYIYRLPSTTSEPNNGAAVTTPSNSQNSRSTQSTTGSDQSTRSNTPGNTLGSASETFGLDGSSLTNSDGQSNDAVEKAEVALDLGSALPDRVEQQDTGTWDTLLSGGYRNQLIGATMLLTIAGAAFFLLRKRYLKKTSDEKSYQKALKVRKISRETTDLESKTKFTVS